MRLWINDRQIHTDESPGMALLDFLRDHLGLVGTKGGCREGDCGACTVLVGSSRPQGLFYEPVCACLTPLVAVADRHVVTVEGLNHEPLGPVQQAILVEGATQCGFCTPGIVLSLTGYLLAASRPSEAGAIASVAGNLCRCTGYESIRRAARRLITTLPKLEDIGAKRLEQLAALDAWPRSLLAAPPHLPLVDRVTDEGLTKRGSGAFIVGGATDLMVQKARVLRGAGVLLSSSLCGRSIEQRDTNELVIGGAATVADLERSALLREEVPRFEQIAALIASPQIRSRATVAGNLVNASPIGDLAVLLLALEASLVLRAAGSQRRVPLDQFFLGYKHIDLRPGELIAEVEVPRRGRGRRVYFEKVSKREHLDIASVNWACSLTVSNGRILEARISAGGVAPVPKLLKLTSAALLNEDLVDLDFKKIADIAQLEVAPIDDVRGSAKYKRLLLGRLVSLQLQLILDEYPAQRRTR